MNKEALVKEIIESLREDLREISEAVGEAYESATHAENVARSKYETASVEAAYLVQGQARRSQELDMEIAAFQGLRIREFGEGARVLLSSLILLEDEEGTQSKLFMGPQSGGLVIDDITVVTPPSPLGQALLGKYAGDIIEVNDKKMTILDIC